LAGKAYLFIYCFLSERHFVATFWPWACDLLVDMIAGGILALVGDCKGLAPGFTSLEEVHWK
jgi:hypothetical protein